EKHRDAKERFAPEPDNPFGDVRPKTCPCRTSLLLKGRPHEEERDEGDRVGNSVCCERQQAADPEEHTTQRLASEIRALNARLVLGDGGRQLLLRDDLRQRRRLREAEEDEEGPLDERDGNDLRERQ